ncbi:MAG: hypothetical protein A4E44_01977 [Methanosaeta sp. PtaB.Bin018]|jgi:hypothetical protein|nr:hypothetical protein [Methanothrix sp.]OPX74405.1 MAG: hypothetical protein A4E44_01977 [Methanosaeta sp. PtaB.Bin018]OPY43580.1 MAG: hypothetical protein A4E46_01737 [Methanosaeta sp. PtaU1.Bin016]
MRFATLIVWPSIILALFAINACSFYDTTGKSVDQLINESIGIYAHNSGFPENPRESRVLWSQETGVNFTMPGIQSGNVTGASKSSDANATDAVQYQSASTMSATQTSTSETASAERSTTSSRTNAAGSWSFELRDSKTRELSLTLFQSEDAIFGTGSMNDGGDTLEVSASGSVEKDRLNLDITSLGIVSLYRLALTTNGDSVSGNYRAFSAGKEPWAGIANGIRTK